MSRIRKNAIILDTTLVGMLVHRPITMLCAPVTPTRGCGGAGDLLVVSERFAVQPGFENKSESVVYLADGFDGYARRRELLPREGDQGVYREDDQALCTLDTLRKRYSELEWQSATKMPYDYVRLILTIEGVRVCHLSEVSEQDAMDLGFAHSPSMLKVYAIDNFMEYWSATYKKPYGVFDDPVVRIIKFSKHIRRDLNERI